MRTDIQFGFADFCIFLGVFQGILISWFFIKKSLNNPAKLYNGLLILCLSLAIFEEFLNNTGLILKVLPLKDFAEPTNFLFGPLFYLMVKSSLYPNKKDKDWMHLLMAGFWVLYMIFYFIQPIEVKYNSHIETKQPSWEFLEVVTHINEDPLGIRNHVNALTAFHFMGYVILAFIVTLKKTKELGESFFTSKDNIVRSIRSSLFHFMAITVIFIIVKLSFEEDLGDSFIAIYITIVIYLTSFQILNDSKFFQESHTFMEIPGLKYKKSTLSSERKTEILSKLEHEMKANKYFKNNLASLSGLAKQIGESNHNVSQVINYKLELTFYKLLANYRIEEAKKIIKEDIEQKITVEELAEMVGYNSKSSFNTAFKSITTFTPSAYRKNNFDT